MQEFTSFLKTQNYAQPITRFTAFKKCVTFVTFICVFFGLVRPKTSTFKQEQNDLLYFSKLLLLKYW